MGEIVDLFAGPGGWSEALRLLGRSADEIGIEYEPNACKTRTAAGHRTLQADVSTIDERQYLGLEGLIASPPCQAFSSAGKGAARDVIPELLDSIRARRWTDRADPDPRVWLIVDLGRWLEHLTPEWIALEQVPAVLPIWQAYADLLRERGYSTWTGILNAADYGVPQTRRRAILIASRARTVQPPEATHDRAPTPSLFGELHPWVTMADALGWRMTDRSAYCYAPGTKGGGASVVEGSGARRGLDAERAAGRWVNTGRRWPEGGRADAQKIDADAEPAPTLTVKSGGQWHITDEWPHDRPATTLMGDPRVFQPGGHHEPGEQSANAIHITIRDALILQSFRPDYPVQGTKTRQFEQVGNAVPPRLAWHVLLTVLPSRVGQEEAVGIEFPT